MIQTIDNPAYSCGMEQACIQEIIDLHKFFQDWFDGTSPKTDAVFARFEKTTTPSFVLVSPDGSLAHRTELAPALYAGHATRPTGKIWVTDAHVLHSLGNQVVMAYQEWQTNDGVQTRRQSTAIFGVDPSTPNGVHWVHVHETWIT